MKRGSIRFLQAWIVLIGIGALAFMLIEPHLEGRNAHATVFEIYFNDPMLAYAYVAAIPFFVVLYQAFSVLGDVSHNTLFSQAAVRKLRSIKYAALLLIGFVVVGEIFILLNKSDDRAGGFALGGFIGLMALLTATAAAMFEGIVRHGAQLQSEHDLTV